MSTPGLTQHITRQDQWPLHTIAQTRTIEHHAQSELPPHTLMARAGLAVGQLAMAIAPHAQTIWIACGPGNNGGDGLEAAIYLQAQGKHPIVTWLGQTSQCPADAQRAWRRAKDAGITIAEQPPAHADLAIDALLGIGAQRPLEGLLAQWLDMLDHAPCPVLCVDVPTGLNADTGTWRNTPRARNIPTQRHTLSLLTLKPGLFTANGRDATGQVWFNDLGVPPVQTQATAWLQQSCTSRMQRPHNSHKGSFGDVGILGGAQGMSGAALLAGIGALRGGAGRVLIGLLDDSAQHAITAGHPALMVREAAHLPLKGATVVCGCGGAEAVHAFMPQVLSCAAQLVLDADALNALARDPSLQRLLVQRSARQLPTVLTPHPLEAARLLYGSTQDVQNNRLAAAQQLASQYSCVVVLKGSGSIIATPNRPPVLNGSGNALLACAGTGDVLAGLIGAYITHQPDIFAATCQAVWAHGHVADTWPSTGPTLDAAALAASVR